MSRVNDAVLAGTKEIFAEIVSTAVDNSPELSRTTSERYPGELRDSIESVGDIREERIFGGLKPDIELAVSQIAQGAE